MREADDGGGADDAPSVLTSAVLRCPDEDVRTSEVFAALERLGRLTGDAAAANRFRKALDLPDRWTRFKEARDALGALVRAVDR